MSAPKIEKRDYHPFFLATVLPKAKAKLPGDLKETNLVWDAVWRAHRDVVLARQYVEAYSAYGKEPWVLQETREPNIIAAHLYEILVQWPQDGEPLGSRMLIGRLLEPFEWNGRPVELDAEKLFGPVQKLVNMTLKYLVMLRTFDLDDDSLNPLPVISPDACDCPLDSVVLSGLGDDFKGAKWTSISRETYEAAQKAIAENSMGSGLIYDLKYWPSEKRIAKSEESA